MKFWMDIRYATRQLRKSPGFSLVAIATLALGIGATTAIFSLVDQVLLRDLPVRDPQRLVMLQYHGSNTGSFSSHGGPAGQYFSYPMYRELRERNSVFSGMIAMYPTQVGVQWHNTPALANAELVTGNYFDVLGVRAALGRLFVQSDEGAKGASPIAVLSFAYWQNRFGSDPSVINQTILINGQPYTIIGVSAPRFRSAIGGSAPELFALINMTPQVAPGFDDLDNERSIWLNLAARLKDNVTLQQAEAGINPLWKALRAEELKKIKNKTQEFEQGFVEKSFISLEDGSKGFSGFRDNLRTPLLILMGMVVLLALMAAANVAGLLLVRAAGRIREMSVRYALGAARWQVVQQLLIEGLLLGVIGGVCGVALAPLLSETLLKVIFSGSGTIPLRSGPDVRTLSFAFGISLCVALLFSVAPVLQFWRPSVAPALKQQTVTASGAHATFRRITVGVQIGLSVILLIGAGLFIRTLRNLQTVDVGFATDHLVTFIIDPRLAGFDSKEVTPLYRRMLEILSALPGVHSVAITDNPDLADNNDTYNLIVPGISSEGEQNLQRNEWERVNPRYLETLKLPLVAGRFVGDQDQLGSLRAAAINELLAKKAFGSTANAIGRTFRVGRGGVELTVVGVVGDTKHQGVRQEAEPIFYTSIFQEQEPKSVEFYVRTYQEPEAAMNMVRQSVRELDSRLVLNQLQTMDDQIGGILINERLLAMLATGFGAVAVLMAGVGLYGVLAFSTSQRTREIGVRMALGASRVQVVKLVIREVLLLGGISIAIAIPIAMALAQVLRGQLYGVSARDPLTMFLVVLCAAVLSCLAAFIPARRASSIDPMSALRYE